MNAAAVPSPDIAETLREDHLRLAVLLDQIQDDIAAALPVGARLTQLRVEFDRHANREEEALARLDPAQLDGHRRGHDRMRALLHHLTAEYDSGHDVSALLDKVVSVFTEQLMPADDVFCTAPTVSAAAQ